MRIESTPGLVAQVWKLPQGPYSAVSITKAKTGRLSGWQGLPFASTPESLGEQWVGFI